MDSRQKAKDGPLTEAKKRNAVQRTSGRLGRAGGWGEVVMGSKSMPEKTF